MNNNYEAMSAVIPKLLAYLEQEGYSKATVGKYRTTFNSIFVFSNGQPDYVFDSEQCSAYVAWLLGEQEYKELPRSCQNKIRCANALLEFQLTGNIFFRKKLKPSMKETGPLYDILSRYLSEKERTGYKEATVYVHKRYMLQFCHLLEGQGIQDFADVSMDEIKKYLDSLSFYKQGSVSSALAPLRCFFHYIYGLGLVPVDYSYLIPDDPAPRRAKLPAHYSQDEVRAILGSIDRANPKGRRNYAIVLLVAETGLRSSDVSALKLDDLHWDCSQMLVEQFKTGNDVVLPLLPSVGNAIIEYLKEGRPQSDCRNVFLRLGPPYHPLTSQQIQNIVSEYIQKSGVNKDRPERRHGSHALRHSLAGRMLENEVPLPVISSVLGHKNAESTAFYLGIDRQALARCPLDVPACTAYGKEG